MNPVRPATPGVDIVLINPPSTTEQEFGLLSGGGAPRPPLNLLNLGALLIQHGYRVAIVDGPVLTTGLDGVVEHVVASAPRFIGITSMTAFIHASGALAARLKHRLPDVPIIIGGIHVSTLPEETLELFPAFDVGVVGEGDVTLVELLQAIEQGQTLTGVPGLVVRAPSGPRRTLPRQLIADLDVLPLPAWELLPDYVTTYQPTVSRRTRLPSAYVVTSRGCPFRCTFCNNVVHGRRFRSYSVSYIMRMIDHLVEHYGIRDVTIYDENLALRRSRIVELCQRMRASGYDLTWSCDARADSVDEEVLAMMHAAGCRSIWYGMESGNPAILKRYDKSITLEKLETAARLTHQHGIKACGSFIIAGPSETPQTIKDTIRFARRLPLAHFVPFFYTPVPGTPDYSDIEQYGTADLDYRSATMTRPTFAPHGMTFADVRYWYMRATLSWYARPSAVWRMLREMGPRSLLKTGFLFIWRGAAAWLPHRERRSVSTQVEQAELNYTRLPAPLLMQPGESPPSADQMFAEATLSSTAGSTSNSR
ncbi:MAG: radical SAM protein [Planctomycetota bacterium]